MSVCSAYIPVKNVIWMSNNNNNLIELPCKKCDMDSHGNSMSLRDKSTVVWSKLTQNSMTIPCHLSRFCLFPCSNLSWILDKFKSWNFYGICSERDENFIGFAKKVTRFPSALALFSTKLQSKRHEKIRVTFFTGFIPSFCRELFFFSF